MFKVNNKGTRTASYQTFFCFFFCWLGTGDVCRGLFLRSARYFSCFQIKGKEISAVFIFFHCSRKLCKSLSIQIWVDMKTQFPVISDFHTFYRNISPNFEPYIWENLKGSTSYIIVVKGTFLIDMFYIRELFISKHSAWNLKTITAVLSIAREKYFLIPLLKQFNTLHWDTTHSFYPPNVFIFIVNVLIFIVNVLIFIIILTAPWLHHTQL